jgi:four helix bundle protein
MQDFRNLKVWEKAHALTLSVYRATSEFPRHEVFGLRTSLRRVAMAIPCKIAEGCGLANDADFTRCLHLAMGSAHELDYQLLLARDLSYLTPETHAPLERDAIEIKKMLAGLIHRMKN